MHFYGFVGSLVGKIVGLFYNKETSEEKAWAWITSDAEIGPFIQNGVIGFVNRVQTSNTYNGFGFCWLFSVQKTGENLIAVT